MITAENKKILLRVIADPSSDVFMINADTKFEVQKKLLDQHNRTLIKMLAQNKSIYLIHSSLSQLK
jgi:hypothetical protein